MQQRREFVIDLEQKAPEGPPAAAGSPLDELRAAYTAIDDEQAQTHVLEVEGTRTVVRYRRMTRGDRNKLARRVLAEDGSGEFEVNAQFLIEACVEILFQDPKTDELRPVLDGRVVTFAVDPMRDTTTLAAALGVEERDARRSVLRLFQGVDEALLRHASLLDAWMGSVQDKTDETFAGGS